MDALLEVPAVRGDDDSSDDDTQTTIRQAAIARTKHSFYTKALQIDISEL